MKKIIAICILLTVIFQDSIAQDQVRGRSIGVSFLMNDFTTASRIRSGSIEQVFRDDQWAKFSDMDPGLALTYFKGVHKKIDFAATLAGSFVNYPFAKRKQYDSKSLLLEADASVNLKMFTDAYFFSPYLIAGIGASRYRSHYGAFIPLGAGFKMNFMDDVSLFVNTTYRVPVTTEITNYHFMYSLGVSGKLGKR